MRTLLIIHSIRVNAYTKMTLIRNMMRDEGIILLQ